MDRRDFIKLTAVSGSGAALASCGNPEHAVIRFVPDEELVPGVAEWKPSVCPLCPAGCGLSVRVMQADVETIRGDQRGVVRRGVAKKLEGAPAHPINAGALCARGQAGLQVTYHPDRITQPLKRAGTRGDGRFEPIPWDEAIADVVLKLDALVAANRQQGLAFVTAGHRSVRQSLVDEFASRFGAPPPITQELFGEDVLRRANGLSFGREQLPTVDLAQTRYLLSFGADFLGTWGSPVSQSLAYGSMRQGRPGVRGAFAQIEARMTPTGACADEWVPAAPGTEGALALGIAHVILRDRLVAPSRPGRAALLIEGWTSGLVGFSPDRVAEVTTVPVARIERLARAFAERRPSAAIIGGPALAQTNGLSAALAVNALNELVGAVGQPGGVFFTPQTSQTITRHGTLEQLAADVLSARRRVELLIVDRANPLFTSPPGWRVADALEQIPFVVSFASFIDDTSARADLVLPDHSFLESWVDAMPETGSTDAVVSVAPPAMKPLFDTRAMPDVLLDVARKLGRPLGLPWQTFEDMLKGTFDALGADAWTTALKQGGWWGALPARAAQTAARAVDQRGSTEERKAATSYAWPTPEFDGDASAYPYHLLPYPSPAFLDGSLAHLPWLQELPDPITTAMWSTWVEINPKTAERLGIRTGDVVELASSAGTVRAPAFVSPGIAPDVVAMPVGQGHQTFTRYASNRGANPVSMLANVRGAHTGAFAWAATRVKVTRVGDPDGRLILFSARGELRQRPYEEGPR
jgi:anaerobic selenocysteine-containing dehydrogenase